jgi:hypothetical protein
MRSHSRCGCKPACVAVARPGGGARSHRDSRRKGAGRQRPAFSASTSIPARASCRSAGQDPILLTRPAHDRGQESLEGRANRGRGIGSPGARTGATHFKGLGEPLELFEVGEEGKARLRAGGFRKSGARIALARSRLWPGRAADASVAQVVDSELRMPRRRRCSSCLAQACSSRAHVFADRPGCVTRAAVHRGPSASAASENDPERQALADGVSRTGRYRASRSWRRRDGRCA